MAILANRPKTMLTLTESLQHVFVWPSENRRPGASDHPKNNEKNERKKKQVLSFALTLSRSVCHCRGTSGIEKVATATTNRIKTTKTFP